MDTVQLAESYNYLAPDQTEIRLLMQHPGQVSIAHGVLRQGLVSHAVKHKTVGEFWYVLSGQGLIWRKRTWRETLSSLVPGVLVDLPYDTEFQFSAEQSDLVFLIISMPPWPGEEEAVLLEGHDWQKKQFMSQFAPLPDMLLAEKRFLPTGFTVKLLASNPRSAVTHCTLKASAQSIAITHKAMRVVWYVLSGEGVLWRSLDQVTTMTKLTKDVCVDIKPGTTFNCEAGSNDLVFLCVSMPPYETDLY